MNIIQQYNIRKDAQKEISTATSEVCGYALGDIVAYSLQTANYNITAMNKRNKYAAKVRPINSDKKTVITGKRASMLCFELFARYFNEARARELKSLHK